MHRYEQVDLPSNKAVTLTLGTNGGRLTPTKAFAMAEKLADHTGLPLVVVDPNGIWNPVWGELYRSTGSRAGGVNEIT